MNTINKCMLILLITLPLFMSCDSNNGATQLEGNRKIVLQYHTIWSNGETEKLNEMMTKDFICHYLTSGEWNGIEGANAEITNWRKLFPDWQEEVIDIIAENDKVVTRYKSTGTHSGTYEGIDSTGIKVEIYETSIYRINVDKIVEQWCFPDDVGLKNQLLKSNQ